MNALRTLIVLAGLLLATPHDALAHGITVTLERHGDVIVAVSRYDGGIPVRGASVTIRPTGDDAPFQTGQTDAEGRFVFMPAATGEWQVTVDDGMGHRRTARIAVAEPEAPPADDEPVAGDVAPEPAPAPAPEAAAPVTRAGADDGTMPWRLVTGLSLLFGITGFGYGYTARSRNRTAA